MYQNCLRCFEQIGADGKCKNCGFDNAAYIPEPHHLPPETVLNGKYRVGKAMGEGGFGITYAGYDIVLKRKVAIKEYFPNGAVWRDPVKSLEVSCYTSQNFRETFEHGRQKCIREAQSLARLDDIPAIVRILDFFTENNTAYIIMEFVEGVTLKDYVRTLSKRLTLTQIMALLRPVTDALDIVHRRGFVHRDISPDNIMVSYDGAVKLLDFGAVKSVTNGNLATENPIVKRGFSPTELYSTKGQIGAWTDVYALAATIFYLLTGSAPDEPLDRMSNDTAPAKLQGVLDPQHAQALLHGLAIQPENRPQSVSALVWELTNVPAQAPVQSVQPVQPVQPVQSVQPVQPVQPKQPKQPRDKRIVIAIAAAAVAVVAIVIGVAVSRNTNNPPAEESTKRITQSISDAAGVDTERSPDAEEIPTEAYSPSQTRRSETSTTQSAGKTYRTVTVQKTITTSLVPLYTDFVGGISIYLPDGFEKEANEETDFYAVYDTIAAQNKVLVTYGNAKSFTAEQVQAEYTQAGFASLDEFMEGTIAEIEDDSMQYTGSMYKINLNGQTLYCRDAKLTNDFIGTFAFIVKKDGNMYRLGSIMFCGGSSYSYDDMRAYLVSCIRFR